MVEEESDEIDRVQTEGAEEQYGDIGAGVDDGEGAGEGESLAGRGQ